MNVLFYNKMRLNSNSKIFGKSIVFIIIVYNNIFCHCFLVRNPLRNILVTKAVSSSVVENLSSELFDNTVLLNQAYSFDLNHHPYFAFYFAGYLWYRLYIKGLNSRNNNDNNSDDNKLGQFDTYKISRSITRQILFVLLFLLTKNVENVY